MTATVKWIFHAASAWQKISLLLRASSFFFQVVHKLKSDCETSSNFLHSDQQQLAPDVCSVLATYVLGHLLQKQTNENIVVVGFFVIVVTRM